MCKSSADQVCFTCGVGGFSLIEGDSCREGPTSAQTVPLMTYCHSRWKMVEDCHALLEIILSANGFYLARFITRTLLFVLFAVSFGLAKQIVAFPNFEQVSLI